MADAQSHLDIGSRPHHRTLDPEPGFRTSRRRGYVQADTQSGWSPDLGAIPDETVYDDSDVLAPPGENSLSVKPYDLFMCSEPCFTRCRPFLHSITEPLCAFFAISASITTTGLDAIPPFITTIRPYVRARYISCTSAQRSCYSSRKCDVAFVRSNAPWRSYSPCELFYVSSFAITDVLKTSQWTTLSTKCQPDAIISIFSTVTAGKFTAV